MCKGIKWSSTSTYQSCDQVVQDDIFISSINLQNQQTIVPVVGSFRIRQTHSQLPFKDFKSKVGWCRASFGLRLQRPWAVQHSLGFFRVHPMRPLPYPVHPSWWLGGGMWSQWAWPVRCARFSGLRRGYHSNNMHGSLKDYMIDWVGRIGLFKCVSVPNDEVHDKLWVTKLFLAFLSASAIQHGLSRKCSQGILKAWYFKSFEVCRSPDILLSNPLGGCNVEDLFSDSSSTYQLKYISGAAGGQHSVLLRNDGKVSSQAYLDLVR